MFEIATLDRLGQTMFGSLLQLVDQVFLRSREKEGTILARYPNLFDQTNRNAVYCALVDGKLSGSVITRVVQFLHDGKIYPITMVGFVCVVRELQGQGIGRQLVSFVSERLVSSNCHGILWTTIPDFYSEHGWMRDDSGVFGVLPPSTRRIDHIRSKFSTIDMNRIEAIRAAWLESRVIRRKVDYDVVPTAVTNVSCLIEGNAPRDSAYLLFGHNDQKAIVYELVGAHCYFDRLISKLHCVYNEVFVNDKLKSNSYQWFANTMALNWLPQSQAMVLNPECSGPNAADFFIPYFDRI